MKGETTIMKNKALGSYLACAVAVLSLVAVIIYGSVSLKEASVNGLMIGAIVLAAASFFLSKLLENSWICALLPVATTAVLTLAVGNAFIPMIDQLGFVVSGLDPFSTIAGFVTFAAVTVVAMLISLVSCFVSFEK